MESQKTCKLFGAIRTVLGIKGALPLIHGPLGCSYHIKYLLSVRSGKSVRILTTEMDQNDVVFGAENKLEKKIIEADKKYSPELIVILTSCASSIIGENIKKVIKDVERNVKAQIISIDAGGFEGTQVDGCEESLLTLIDMVDSAGSKDDSNLTVNSSINLIGQFRGGHDLKNLIGDFQKLNININCILTSSSSLDDIKNATKASLNVVMCEASGIVPCEAMQKKFGTPFLLETIPIGISSTSNFFHKICNFLDVKYTLKGEEENARHEIEKCSKYLNNKKVAIIAGPTRSIALTNFVCELGMEPALISLDFEGKTTMKNLEMEIKRNKINPIVLREPEYDELLKNMRNLDIDMILGGLGETGISKELKIPLLDVMHASEVTMGFKGAVNLSKNVKNIIKNN